MSLWCETALIDGAPVAGVRLELGPDARIARVSHGVLPELTDTRLGTVFPGMANAHSHAFHRLLRGRTHTDGGDFWRWRTSMYAAAGMLDPEKYFTVARGVFAEMLAGGYTAVGEFHYLHHRTGGTPYLPPHAMELALAAAARDVGIRLTLLDTCYLAGGIDRPLEPDQRSFGDGSANGWLDRWNSLSETLGTDPAQLVTLGAALHSVRAVPVPAMKTILAELPATIPMHIHLSEQPQENADCLAAYAMTPTELLDSLDALTPRLSLVHATHLTDSDIALIGASGATVVMCPTTEADLGDGIGPAKRLADAGAQIALGSDQNAVVDPLLEMRGLEMGERLASGQRGRFDPIELLDAATVCGYASLGLTAPGAAGDGRGVGLGVGAFRVGALCDLVEINTTSTRTLGSVPAQLPLTATASDVKRVIVHGSIVADGGLLVSHDPAATPRRPDHLLAKAFTILANTN
jgi:formiminoglutamate deiminase